MGITQPTDHSLADPCILSIQLYVAALSAEERKKGRREGGLISLKIGGISMAVVNSAEEAPSTTSTTSTCFQCDMYIVAKAGLGKRSTFEELSYF